MKNGLIDNKNLHINKKKINPIDEDYKNTNFPFVSIYDTGFTFEKIGIGYIGGQQKSETIEQEFDGNGKNLIFNLSDIPLRPLISIQSPKGIAKKEKDDYVCNYFTKQIRFNVPPEKGKKNVIVKYVLAKNSSEIKILRLKFNCIIDIWSNVDNVECDSITLQIIKTILLNEGPLNSKNIHIQGVDCINLKTRLDNIQDDNDSNNDNNNNYKKNSNKSSKLVAKENKDDSIFGRRLNYNIESDIRIDTPIPIIKDIVIKEKRV